MLNTEFSLQLTYRVYARQMQSHGDFFDDVLGQVRRVNWGDTPLGELGAVTATEESPFRMAVLPPAVPAAKDKGWMIEVSEDQTQSSVIVYGLVIRVALSDAAMCREILAKIVDSCGRVFTNVRIVEEIFTDCSPR